MLRFAAEAYDLQETKERERDDFLLDMTRSFAQRATLGNVFPPSVLESYITEKLLRHRYLDYQGSTRRLTVTPTQSSVSDGRHFGSMNQSFAPRLGARLVIANSGNRYREQMAAMIEQDLQGRNAPQDRDPGFSFADRAYLAYLRLRTLPAWFVNVDLDPSAQTNVWLSSSSNHAWNPEQKTPAAPWEAEIDHLMQAQASTPEEKRRKHYFDQMQETVWEQQPFIYLVNKNALAAISPSLANTSPVVLRPQTFWNIESLNTPDGKGHRLVVRFIAGELVKTTHTSPDWLKNVFGRELSGEGKQREGRSRRM